MRPEPVPSEPPGGDEGKQSPIKLLGSALIFDQNHPAAHLVFSWTPRILSADTATGGL
jgi:hypothetical protein